MSIGYGTELTKQVLHDKFDYVPIDKGRPLIFKHDNKRSKRGDPAGHLCKRTQTYKIGFSVSKKPFNKNIHRLVWLWKHPGIYNYSEMPKILDHINRNHLDNRYENLRPASPGLNSINCKLDPGNRGSSQYRGVHLFRNKSNGYVYEYWKASFQGKLIGLYPPTPQGEIDAALGYDRALWKKFPGETSCLNFPKEKANYMGLNSNEQLEFGFIGGNDKQEHLDFSTLLGTGTEGGVRRV